MLGGREGRDQQIHQQNPELTLIPPIKCPFWLLGGRDGRCQRHFNSTRVAALWYYSTHYYYIKCYLIHCYIVCLLCVICLTPMIYLLSNTILSLQAQWEAGWRSPTVTLVSQRPHHGSAHWTTQVHGLVHRMVLYLSWSSESFHEDNATYFYHLYNSIPHAEGYRVIEGISRPRAHL